MCFLPIFKHRVGQLGDGVHVLHGLRRVADHEVELDGGPAAAEDLLGGPQQVLGGDGLVDHVAQAVGGGFGGEGEAAASPAAGQLLHQVDREAFDAQAGQADAQLLVAVPGHDRLHQLGHAAVVAAAQAEQADLLEAGGLQDLVHCVQHLLHWPLAHRPEDHAGLAEAAAPRAAALDLDGRAVVDGVDERHDEVGGGRGHGRQDALDHRGRRCVVDRLHLRHRAIVVVAHGIQMRHVHPADARQAAPEVQP